MKRVIPKVQKRLKDPDPAVVGAALIVSADVVSGSVSASRMCLAHGLCSLECRRLMAFKKLSTSAFDQLGKHNRQKQNYGSCSKLPELFVQ